MRFKNRYFLCSLTFADSQVDQSITSSMIYRALLGTLEEQWGDYGMGVLSQSFSVKYYNALTGLVLIRSARDHYRMLWSVIKALTNIRGRQCRLVCTHVGGTIRACQKAALEQTRSILLAKDQASLIAAAITTVNAATGLPITPASAAAATAAGIPLDPIRAATVSATLAPSATGLPTVFAHSAGAGELDKAEKSVLAIDSK